MSVTTGQQEKLESFFKIVFEGTEGFVCLAKINRPTREFQEEYFHFPEAVADMAIWCEHHEYLDDVYFCPQMLREPKREKASVNDCTCAWADLDSCHPRNLLIQPTITIESSPNRFQALWVFAQPENPVDAEEISRRIAYYHADDGADRSGWDLTQLVRVPFTINHKYGEGVPVKVIATGEKNFTLNEFRDAYPPAKGYGGDLDLPLPTGIDLANLGDADDLMQQFSKRLMPSAWTFYQTDPQGDDDWSKALWQLQLMLYEAGMSPEQVYVVCSEAKCNKYKRDGRPTEYLWKEVCRAFRSFEERHRVITSAEAADSPLLTDEERALAERTYTFVEEYIDWAKSLGDAAPQYHQAGAFIVLSSLLAGPVRLPTSFGTVVPNLWFMILADTTLTRKTTAMDIAVELLADVSSDAILATDGSIEGLFTSLSMRPGKPSVFLRDEFSGLLEAMVKKDYYAGMGETLTKLYDGKMQKRVLRKETIEVRNPVLIIFAGGIKTRILSLLDFEHVASGFLPRFVFITAESDTTRLKPLGPPTTETIGHRDLLTAKLQHLASHYSGNASINVDGKSINVPKEWDAELTSGAWLRYNKFENDMLTFGLKSSRADIMTPTMDRLSKSVLKAATLIAASSRLDSKVVVTEQDLIKAIAYGEQWRDHAIEIVNGVGSTTYERQIMNVLKTIKLHPGILRSELMQSYHLRARDCDVIFDTLDQRGLIIRQRTGKTEKLFPIK